MQREEVLSYLAEDNHNHAKWLTVLMDIDDEMEEIAKSSLGDKNEWRL